MVETVLIAIKKEAEIENIFNFYMKTIHRPGHEVFLLHVYESIQVPAAYYITENFNEEDLLREAREIQAKNQAVEKKFCELCIAANGDSGVGAIIIENVKSSNAAMIIVGTRGFGRIKRAFVGSVSKYVLHHSPVPVFVCPETD